VTVYAAPKPIRVAKPPKEKKPRSRIASKNPARKRERFISDFGGAALNELLKSLPCVVCGIKGFSLAAHLKTRGSGGKADVQVPMCATRGTTEGCHEKYDRRVPEVRAYEERLKWFARGFFWCWNAIT
jgi:hypothetical protein